MSVNSKSTRFVGFFAATGAGGGGGGAAGVGAGVIFGAATGNAWRATSGVRMKSIPPEGALGIPRLETGFATTGALPKMITKVNYL